MPPSNLPTHALPPDSPRFICPDLVSSAFHLAIQTIHARRASLLLPTPENPCEFFVAQAQGLADDIVQTCRVQMGAPIAGWVAAQRQPILCATPSADLIPFVHRVHYATPSFISTPILAREDVIGILNMADKTNDLVFDEDDLRVLTGFADHLAACLRAQNLQQQSWALARCDSLTGVGNRQALNEFLQDQVEFVQTSREPLACLMIDLDAFKAINDRFGHAVGDIVLAAVAQAIKTQVRPRDRVFRYGGDEFIVFLPATDWTGAALIARRIQHAIAQSARCCELTGCSVTASVGIATFPSDANHLGELIERADAKMYACKPH